MLMLVHPRNPIAAPSRVLFYGVTGSGKSSAARAYAARTGLPEFSADDDIGWLPGWRQPSTAKQRELAARIVGQDQWVLDSAYGVWRDLVVPRAELIVGSGLSALAFAAPADPPLASPGHRAAKKSATGTGKRSAASSPPIRSSAGTSVRSAANGGSCANSRALPAPRRSCIFRHPRELEAWLQRLPTADPQATR